MNLDVYQELYIVNLTVVGSSHAMHIIYELSFVDVA